MHTSNHSKFLISNKNQKSPIVWCGEYDRCSITLTFFPTKNWRGVTAVLDNTLSWRTMTLSGTGLSISGKRLIVHHFAVAVYLSI